MNTSDHVDATSTSSRTPSSSLKEKAIEEFIMFWVIAIYLAGMLVAFAWYRRLVLSESGISYFHAEAAVVTALIIAKVILMAIATLIPFFAFWETDQVMGNHKLFNLFFRNRTL